MPGLPRPARRAVTGDTPERASRRRRARSTHRAPLGGDCGRHGASPGPQPRPFLPLLLRPRQAADAAPSPDPGPAARHSARAPRHLTRPAPPPALRTGALLRMRLCTHREGRGAVLRVRCPALRPPQRSAALGVPAAGRGRRGAAAEAGRARRLRPPSCAAGAAPAGPGCAAGSAGCAGQRALPDPLCQP